MATVKINCPKCQGTGLTGAVAESVCSQCLGKGVISVTDTDSISTISAASVTPIIVTTANAVPPVAVKNLGKGK